MPILAELFMLARRTTVLSLALLSFCPVVSPPAEASEDSVTAADAAATDGSASTILPLDRERLEEGGLIIPVSVNGKGPFPFAFDTGSHALIETRLAEELAMARRPGGQMWGYSGVVAYEVTTVERLTLGSIELRDQAAMVISNEAISTEIDVPYRGLVGAELLQRFIAIIDYRAATLTLTLPDRFEPPADAIALPVEYRVYQEFDDPTPMVPARIDGVEGGFLIDTGAGGGITLIEHFIATHDLATHYEKRLLTHHFGYGGIGDDLVSRARSFQIGSTTVLEPVVVIPLGDSGPEPPGLVRQDKGRDIAGSVGNAILHHFTVIFDYPHRRILLTPPTQPFPFRADWNRAGFFPACHAGTCKVLQVLPHSPAAEAGIREGDSIRSLEGTAAAALPAVIGRVLNGPAGTVVKLSVTGASGEREISLVLRDLI
jgi:hypothetical protein